MSNRYAGFFAAYKASIDAGNTNTKEECVEDFTNGKTTSLRDLSDIELEGLVSRLNSLSRFKPQNPPGTSDKADQMRKSIIAIFKQMNRTTEDAKNWAEKQGVKKVKKKFNNYTTSELFTLIRIAEKIRADWQTGVRKTIGKL